MANRRTTYICGFATFLPHSCGISVVEKLFVLNRLSSEKNDFFSNQNLWIERRTLTLSRFQLFWGVFPVTLPIIGLLHQTFFWDVLKSLFFLFFSCFFLEYFMAPNWYFLQEFYVCSLKFGLFSDNFWKGCHENFWKKIWGVIERTYIRCQINFFSCCRPFNVLKIVLK